MELPVTHKGNGKIVIMDDERVIQDVLGVILRTLGYVVVCKNNGEDTIAYITEERNAGRKIDGMIFDLTIPGGMGGKDIIGDIRALCPETPVIVASGYADDPVMASPEEYGFTASICKPFRKAELENLLNKYMIATK